MWNDLQGSHFLTVRGGRRCEMSDFDCTIRIVALRPSRPAAGEEAVLDFQVVLHERNCDPYGLTLQQLVREYRIWECERL